MTLPLHLAVGPAAHGVNDYCLKVARSLGADTVVVDDRDVLAIADPGELTLTGRRVHLHFTDQLFGRSAAEAAAAVGRIAGEASWLGVTLHDVPQMSDGETNFPLRTEAYRRVVETADCVIANSEHERLLLAEAGIPAEAVHVIPLPLPELADGSHAVPRDLIPAAGRASADQAATIGVFGYIYPGKGYEEAIEAAGAQSPPARVLAMGTVATGHDWLLDRLKERAGELGVELEVTGYVPDEEVLGLLQSVDVPVCFHRHFSASGSINSWIAACRRPLVPDVRYTREMAELRPSTLTLVEDGSLTDHVTAALASPERTWLKGTGAHRTGKRARPLTLPHRMEDVALAYSEVFARSRREIAVVIPYYDDGVLPPVARGKRAAGQTGTGKTHRGRKTLAQRRLSLVLDALEAQSLSSGDAARVSITVADDGSPIPPTLPETVACLRQEDLGFRAGAARNLGAFSSSGRVLVFLDGDTVPEPDFLERLTAPLLSGAADLTVGRREHAHLTGPTRGLRLEAPAWLSDLYDRTENLAAADAKAYQGIISAVMAIDAALFRRLGGFDESLCGYGGEDWELAHRAWLAGARLAHVPEAVAVHDGSDWGERGGRDDAGQLAVKNRESLALAARIAASWTRPRGAVFANAEVLVRLDGCAAEAGEHAVIAWACAVLDELGDVRIELPSQVPLDFFAAEPRVRHSAPSDAGPQEAESPGSGLHRYLLSVHALFRPTGLRDAVTALDAALENGPLGGASRRARLAAPDGCLLAELISVRALAISDGSPLPSASTSGETTTAKPSGAGPAAASSSSHEVSGLVLDAERSPEHPDLERAWGGW